MTRLDFELLRQLGVKESRAALWLEPVKAATALYDIESPYRLSAFLGQILHESGYLRYVREIWGPTPAQQRYEGRKDLGNTQPGDGKRLLRRGLIQVTGRANYAAMSKQLGINLVKNPELLERPDLAAISAAHFWSDKGLNKLADELRFRDITRKINGGYNGLLERQAIYNKALAYLIQG